MRITDIKSTRSLNKGTTRGKRVLKRSIKLLGYLRGIVVDRNDKVLVGNKVFEEALERGSKIRLVETQGDELIVIKRKDIDFDTRKAKEIMLVDNLTSDLGLCYDTDYIIDTMNKNWGFDPREWEGHSCMVRELSVEDCIKEGLENIDKKSADTQNASNQIDYQPQLSLFD